MRAGRLRERIEIRRLTVTDDGMGGRAENWTTVVRDVPAEVVLNQSQSRFVGGAGQEPALATHTVRLRGQTDISPLDRIVWNGRLLDVTDANRSSTRPPVITAVCRVRVGERP